MMRMKEDNVFRGEHKLIKEALLWEGLSDDRLCHALLAYVCGINDMAEEMVECLKALK